MNHKINYGTYLFIAFLTFTCIGTFAMPVMAEGASSDLGNGAFGVNRRVRSTTGIVGIVTRFTSPTSHNNPSEYEGKEYSGVEYDVYVDGSNEQQTKPSFYIGLRGLGDDNQEQEIDAGIQWEYTTPVNPSGGWYKAGWSAFISWDHAPDFNNDGQQNRYTNVRINGQPWRESSLGDYVDLICQATPDGGVKLSVTTYSGNQSTKQFSFYWDDSHHNSGSNDSGYTIFDTNSSGGITHAAVNSMSVKRVVAITQQGAQQCDGSYMDNLVCQTLSLATPSFDENYDFIPQWSPTSGWPLAYVDQDETEYTAGQDEDDPPHWMVDFNFEGIDKPINSGPEDSNGEYRSEIVQARYDQETVSISLRTQPAHIAGIKVQNTTG